MDDLTTPAFSVFGVEVDDPILPIDVFSLDRKRLVSSPTRGVEKQQVRLPPGLCGIRQVVWPRGRTTGLVQLRKVFGR